MSLSLTIAVVVLADLLLIGLLAFVMSHAVRLTPHEPRAEENILPARTPAPRTFRAAGRSASRARATASSRS
ncbi:MAG: hypothetical protein QOE38_3017 [Thermoleophilaceae bacterium]|jgi:hypothetical protein|nr:hypothetical protein [Thermoleophilaceae bacterium]